MAEKKSLLNKVIDAVSDRDEKAAAAAAKAKAQAQVAANARAKVAVERAKTAKVVAEKAAVAKAITLKKHVVQQGETWTHLAQKYYGRSIEPFWKFIVDYPTNKALVGGDYKKLKAGMEIVIPELSEELKNMPIIKPSK